MLRLSKSLFIVLALFLFIGSVNGNPGSDKSKAKARRNLKVLIYSPNGAYSHFHLMVRLAELLTERGHKVTMLMPNQYVPNAPKDAAYKIVPVPTTPEPKHLQEGGEARSQAVTRTDHRYIEKNLKEWADMLGAAGVNDALETAKNMDVMDKLMMEGFDVGITEAWYFGGFALHTLLGIKTTVFCVAQPLYPALAYFLGLPHPDHIPEMYSAQAGDGIHMSEERKAKNELDYWHSIGVFTKAFDKASAEFDEVAKKHYGWKIAFPKLQNLLRKASYMFVNTNRHMDFERPLPPQVQYFGGIQIRPGDLALTELKPETQELVDKAEGKPIIVFSFGSAYPTRYFTLEHVKAFLDAFTSFDKYQFVWKFETDKPEIMELIEQVPNIQLVKWFQQKEILNLEQTKAFISHCGLNSTNEALQFGVPIVCVPLFGDQPYNAAMVEHRGIGVFVQLVPSDGTKLTAETIKEALWKVLTEEKYAKNMKELKDIVNDPNNISPAELFLNSVEAAAEVKDENSETRIMGELPDKWTYISEKPRDGINMYAAPPSASPKEIIEMQIELENMEAREKEKVEAKFVPNSSAHKANNPKGAKKQKNSKKNRASHQRGSSRH